MKPIIYFLSKIGPGHRGGQLIRAAQVKLFRDRGYRVIFVSPRSGVAGIPSDDVIDIDITVPQRISLALQHAGLVDDYLHQWANKAVSILRSRVTSDDIVFASAGGELGCLRVGFELKQITGCRYIANLHDPTTYADVAGIRVGRRPHVARNRWEGKYLSNADVVLTSTRSYGQALAAKYPVLASRLRHAYFGYVTPIQTHGRTLTTPMTVAYGGTFLKTQSPEWLAEVAVGMPGVNIAYIGHHESYRPLDPYRERITCLPPMMHAEYNEFLAAQVDVGFVALAEPEWQFCVPSKIFEYINAGVPILGALPPGEAAGIINDSEYGIAVQFGDTAALKNAIEEFQDEERWQHFRQRILEDRESWALSERMGEIMDGILVDAAVTPPSRSQA